MMWTWYFIQAVLFENNVFLFLEKHGGFCFHLNGPTIMSSSPQEEPCYSQLKAGRDPCSCNCQIPLRHSLNPPTPQQLTQTQTHTSELKHALLSLTPGSTNMLCVMLYLNKSAPSSSNLCRHSPRRVTSEEPDWVYHCINMCMTFFRLKSFKDQMPAASLHAVFYKSSLLATAVGHIPFSRLD